MKENLKILFFLLLLNYSLSQLKLNHAVKGKCIYMINEYSLYDFHSLTAKNDEQNK